MKRVQRRKMMVEWFQVMVPGEIFVPNLAPFGDVRSVQRPRKMVVASQLFQDSIAYVRRICVTTTSLTLHLWRIYPQSLLIKQVRTRKAYFFERIFYDS